MKVETKDGITIITADDGKAIHKVGEPAPSHTVGIRFPEGRDDPVNWEDCELGEPKGEAMKYSRWGIIKALEKRGLADAFDEYLDANKAAFRRFYGPQFFAADDADFKNMHKTMQEAFKLSDDDIGAILAESPYIED